jgi:hypothetical protein
MDENRRKEKVISKLRLENGQLKSDNKIHQDMCNRQRRKILDLEGRIVPEESQPSEIPERPPPPWKRESRWTTGTKRQPDQPKNKGKREMEDERW